MLEMLFALLKLCEIMGWWQAVQRSQCNDDLGDIDALIGCAKLSDVSLRPAIAVVEVVNTMQSIWRRVVVI